MIIIIFLYALSAAKLVLSKQALSYVPPIFLVALHNGIAGILLLAYHVIRRKSVHIRPEHIPDFIKAIIFGVYIPYILRFWGLQYMPAYKASLLLGVAPFISYFMSYWLCQETWTQSKLLGLSMGFIGMLPILIMQAQQESTLTSIWFLSSAEIATLISTISLIYGWISIKRLIKENIYESSFLNGIGMAFGGFLALGTSYLKESVVIAQENILTLVVILTFIILIGNIFVHTMYVRLLKKFNVTLLAFAKLLSPIFTALYGWFLFGDVITWHFFAGLIFLFSGLTIFYREELKMIL